MRYLFLLVCWLICWSDACAGTLHDAQRGLIMLRKTCTVTETPETTCNDSIDNDCDGLVDGADSDCNIYTDIIFHYNAENTAVAEIGGTGTNSGMTFDGTLYRVGTYSLNRDSSYDYLVFTATTSNFEKAGGQIGFWWYNENGYQAGSANRLVRITDTVNDIMSIYIHSSGGLKLSWDSESATEDYAEYTASSLTTATWFYIVCGWNPGATGNDLVLTIYDTSGSVVGSAADASITAFTTDPSQIIFGNSSGDAVRFRLDNIIITNDESRDMWSIRNVNSF